MVCLKLLVIWVLMSFFVVNAQRPGFGKCPNYKSVNNFQPERFQGQWYETERSFYMLEIPTSCTTLKFTVRPDGIFSVLMKAANKWNGNTLLSLTGTATPSQRNIGDLMFKIDSNLPQAIVRALPGVGHYRILGTDYDSYAVLYSCSDLGFLHADLLWVLSRTKELPVTARVQVYSILNVLNIDPSRLTLTKHQKCPEV